MTSLGCDGPDQNLAVQHRYEFDGVTASRQNALACGPYTAGAEPNTVEAAIQLLRDRFRGLREPGELLREQMAVTAAQGREPDTFISREYAEREPRLRPRVIVIDECQNLFMS